ncbi:MAG: UDP-glucose/GDP-mannose dehydrogenase family protein [Methanosarcinales archaeon]|nr:MAG: UDP-glucose/GDP-mannose dehydrogenase family protein [Methanosarcinales archaeon]
MKLKVSIIGIGPVGLVTGVAFAEHGHEVIVADIDKERVNALNNGKPPFYEPGLDSLVNDLVSGGLLRGLFKPSNDSENLPLYYKSIRNTDITFICVGTPPNPDGSMNLEYIKKASMDIGAALNDKKKYHLVVSKSTIVPGTTGDIILKLIEEHSSKKRGVNFGGCSNPEFLLQGSALAGALNPDRIVIGELDKKSGDVLMELYRDFDEKIPRLKVGIKTAEMIKYASNSLLATKISFANEMANICEKFGVDVYEVMEGVGLDYRINPGFLRAGVGFGGSCFPKDVKAIASASRSKGLKVPLLDSVLLINEEQPLRAVELAESAAGDLKDKDVCILGLSFKPDTDDVRETRALPILMKLLEKGCRVTGYDPEPKAVNNFRRLFHQDFSPINFARSIEEAIKDKDIVIIQNEWEDFKKLEPGIFKTLMNKNPVIIDGRRIYDPEIFLKEGITYRSIGWKRNF